MWHHYIYSTQRNKLHCCVFFFFFSFFLMKTFLLSRTYPLPRMTGSLIMKISSSLLILMVWEDFFFFSPFLSLCPSPFSPLSLLCLPSHTHKKENLEQSKSSLQMFEQISPSLIAGSFMWVIMFSMSLTCRCGKAPALAFTLTLYIRSRRSTAGELWRWAAWNGMQNKWFDMIWRPWILPYQSSTISSFVVQIIMFRQ